MVKIQAEIVNGECPTCSELTMLVGLTPELFRCMNCGSDLQQHVNGKINWPNKVLNFLHLVINLKNVDPVNIKNLSQREKKDKKD